MTHPDPHACTDEGGCACTCPLCIELGDDVYRCVCSRCNQACSGIGRIGRRDIVDVERTEGWPLPGGVFS